MAYTRKQIVTGVSVLYLIIATGVAGYAFSRINSRSVPISETLTGFTTALPILAGLLLEGGYNLTRREERQKHLGRGRIQRPPLVIIANTVIFIYSTVVITLLGTHAAPPSGLDCGLRDRWQSLFRAKDERIKRIQEALQCCGLKNTRDMPWPFPDKDNKPDACEKAFNRHIGCLESWKMEEQRLAGILMGVVFMVFIWQFVIIVTPTQQGSWIHRVLPDRVSHLIDDERDGGMNGSQRAIDYISPPNRYSDRVEEEEDSHSGNGNPTRAIEEGNVRLNNALPGHLERDQQPSVENEWTRT